MNGTSHGLKVTNWYGWGWKHTVFSVTELLDGPEQGVLVCANSLKNACERVPFSCRLPTLLKSNSLSGIF